MNFPTSLSDSFYISRSRPRRDKISFLINAYQLIIGILVSLIILVAVGPASPGLFWLILLLYWGYIGLNLYYRGTEHWRKTNQSKWHPFLKASLVILGVTILLYLLYYHTIYLQVVDNDDSLWLLYLLAIYIMSQRGSTGLLVVTLGIAALSLFFVTPRTGTIILQLPGLKALTSGLLAKILWLGLLSFILYIYLRYLGDIVADFNLIRQVQDGLRTIEETFLDAPDTFNEKKYLEDAAEQIAADLGYNHVNVFRLYSQEELECVAGACGQGKALAKTGYRLRIDEQESIIGYVSKTGKSYWSNQALKDRHFYRHAGFPDTQAELVLPIYTHQRLYGVLDVQVHQAGYFLKHDVEAMQILANHLGWVLDYCLQQPHNLRINDIMRRIARRFLTKNDIEETLYEIAEAAFTELKADLVILYSYDSKNDILLGPYYAGKPLQAEALHQSVVFKDNVVYRLLAAKQEIYLNPDLSRQDLDPQIFQPSDHHIRKTGRLPFIEREKIRAHAIIRLLNDADCVGLLFLNFRSPRGFTSWDLRTYFTFAHLAALAIQKMQFQQRAMQLELAELANNLHDTLIGDTLGLHKLLGAMRIPENEDEKRHLLENIHAALELSDHLHNDIRYIHRLLKERTSDNFALEVDKLIMIYQDIFKVEIEPEWHGEVQSIKPVIAGALKFIVREALTNAIRHGKAKRIHMVTTVEPGQVSLVVADNGLGFDTEKVKRANGLVNMRNRITNLSGNFEIVSRLRQGTRISVSLPQ